MIKNELAINFQQTEWHSKHQNQTYQLKKTTKPIHLSEQRGENGVDEGVGGGGMLAAHIQHNFRQFQVVQSLFITYYLAMNKYKLRRQ